MQMIIKKWGNSLATRIPKAIVESINLRLDEKVNIEAINGRIVITPIRKKTEYHLDDLLSQCKPEAMRIDDEDNNWLDDKPMGKEVW